MRLYHGGTQEVRIPRIISGTVGRDFGPAFYTTEIRAQAERWAMRRALIDRRAGQPDARAVVSVYEADLSLAGTSLRRLSFPAPTLEWLDMVVACRSNPDFRHGFDLIAGKIADDSVGETVSYVVAGVMPKEIALERLKFQNINSQIAFCSPKSLALLRFVSAYEVESSRR